MAIGIAEAQFAALFVESVFYGLYLATFFRCLQTLLWIPNVGWKPLRNIGVTNLFVTLILCFLGTFNLALAVVRNVQGLFHNAQGGAVIPIGAPWISIVKSFFFNLQTTIADAVLIYRCWVVCERSISVVVLPIFLWISGTTLNLAFLILLAGLRPGDRRTANNISDIGWAFWACAITLNVYATCMIVYRLWAVDHERVTNMRETGMAKEARHRTTLYRIMRIIVDSALIYTVFTIIYFGTNFKGNAVYITSAMECQIIGIAFNLILIRVSRDGLAVTNHPTDSRGFSSMHFKTIADPGARSLGDGTHVNPSRTVLPSSDSARKLEWEKGGSTMQVA